jgi:CheY-like chemotaxis protein
MQDQDYVKILSVINTLDQSKILSHLADNCVLAADVVQNMLYGVGVSSMVSECQLMISDRDESGKEILHLIGYDIGKPQANQINTHTVVITKGDNPRLIDVSVGNYLGNAKHVVVTNLLDSPDATIMAQCQVGTSALTYRTKKDIQLPGMHQKDLISRIQQEYQLLKNVRTLKIIVTVALILTTVNSARGFHDYYSKYFSDSTEIGISANREILDRLQSIEQVLERK